MAHTVEFDGCNRRMTPPKDTTEEQVRTAAAFYNGACYVMAWKLTPEELAEINRTGLVWQSIWSNGLPPSYVGSESFTHGLVADFGAVWPLSKQPKEVNAAADCKICDNDKPQIPLSEIQRCTRTACPFKQDPA